ncbi:MAG TPA: hypothetical protein VKV20_20300 [Ktedonobacteraceae bacterium]|jgi:hypothetical protein|nr:hypothetical protein [Ktedonobacteraceae bacterium]
MDQMRMQQRNKRMPARQEPVTDDALDFEDEFDETWPTRSPSSARRYLTRPDVYSETGHRLADVRPFPSQKGSGNSRPERYTDIPPRRSATQTNIPAIQANRPRATRTGDVPTRRQSYDDRAERGRRVHWILFVGLAMLIMVLGWVAFNALENWWQVTQDDWHYGRPRTFQTDAVVGHNDSPQNPSHFIAINLNRQIIIIEIPGGDASKTRIFYGPTLMGNGQNLTPVTLTFKDVNGDGKPDMIVNIQDTHIVFINTNGTFRPAPAGGNSYP